MSIPVDGIHVDFENVPRDMLYQVYNLVKAHLRETLVESKDMPRLYFSLTLIWINLLVIDDHELLSEILAGGIIKSVFILLVTGCLTSDARDNALDVVIV